MTGAGVTNIREYPDIEAVFLSVQEALDAYDLPATPRGVMATYPRVASLIKHGVERRGAPEAEPRNRELRSAAREELCGELAGFGKGELAGIIRRIPLQFSRYPWGYLAGLVVRHAMFDLIDGVASARSFDGILPATSRSLERYPLQDRLELLRHPTVVEYFTTAWEHREQPAFKGSGRVLRDRVRQRLSGEIGHLPKDTLAATFQRVPLQLERLKLETLQEFITRDMAFRIVDVIMDRPLMPLRP